MMIKHILILFQNGRRLNMVCPRVQYLDKSFFFFYVNDLPKVVNNNSKPVLFADDTSIIVSSPSMANFKNDLTLAFEQLNTWFNTNLLSLNYNKMECVQFRTTNSLTIQIDISYNNRYIVNSTNTRFLCITLDSSLSWRDHNDGLRVKLSKACYAIRFLRPLVSHELPRMIYYSYFHAVVSYNLLGEFLL
jgi:hypothetical protein